MGRRIAVTGLGAVSALGLGAQANWEAAREGRSGIAAHLFEGGEYAPEPVRLPAALTPDGYAGALEGRFGRKVSGSLDRFALLGLCAAYEALENAGLVDHPALSQRTAIVLGHGQGGQATLEKSYERFFGLRSQRMHPGTVPKVMVSGGVSAVAMQFGVHGPTFATSSACASSAHAIVQGAGLILAGLADIAIVGGSEAIATAGRWSRPAPGWRSSRTCSRAWRWLPSRRRWRCRRGRSGSCPRPARWRGPRRRRPRRWRRSGRARRTAWPPRSPRPRP